MNSKQRIIAIIENLTSHDYGCTEVKIDRSGTGAVAWGYNQSTPAGIFKKNYKITPTNPNPSGSYKVRFYYTENVTNTLLNSTNNKERKGGIILKERELEFLKLTCSEMTYKEIAGVMCLSPKTVENYRESLFDKVNAKTRIGLVLYAIKEKIVIL